MTFRALLKRLRKHYPTVRAFAAALEMDPSHLSRAMGEGGQPFDIRGCLRLAQVTGENPTVVLRAAGKADIATLVEELYGPSHALLTPEQQQLLRSMDAIQDPVVRQSIVTVARAAATASATGSSGSEGGETGGGSGTPPPTSKEPKFHMDDDFAARRVRAAR